MTSLWPHGPNLMRVFSMIVKATYDIFGNKQLFEKKIGQRVRLHFHKHFRLKKAFRELNAPLSTLWSFFRKKSKN